MILPIVTYGASILRTRGIDISPDYPGLEGLIANMWDTLYNADGCGLAAPQVNLPYRLFVVDSRLSYEDMSWENRQKHFDADAGIKQVFINPRMITRSEEHLWQDREGCLSIPGLSELVERPWKITIAYHDQEFKAHKADFSGLTARMIQHEYDHIEGKLYLDHLSQLKRQMMHHKLDLIAKRKIVCPYPLV